MITPTNSWGYFQDFGLHPQFARFSPAVFGQYSWCHCGHGETINDADHPVKFRDPDANPRLTRKGKPTLEQRQGHEKGFVTIGVLVDYDGRVKGTSPVFGDPVLADVATRAIKQWEF